MKRALSFILALTLAFALLPTFASAETTGTETETTGPKTFTIDFSAYTTPKELAWKDTAHALIGPETQNKSFAGDGWNALLDEVSSTIYAATTGTAFKYMKADEYVYFDMYNSDANGLNVDNGYNTFSLTFTVPASGVYDISAGIRNLQANHGYAQMEIDGVDIGKIENYRYGDVYGNVYKDSEGTGRHEREFTQGVCVALSAGSHTMKLEFTLYTEGQTQLQLGFYDIIFTPSEVASTSVKLSKTTYEIGETFLPGVSFTVGEEIIEYNEIPEGIGFELISSDESVVKCSDSAFIALTAGTADLSAKVSVNGVETEAMELGTVTVSPAAEAKEFTLDFAKRFSSVDDLKLYEGSYYFSSTSHKFFGSNWTANGNENVSTMLNAGRRMYILSDYFSMNLSAAELGKGYDTIEFRIYAPATGVYDIASDVYVRDKGGYLKLYIDGVYVGENCLNIAAHGNGAGKKRVTHASAVSITAGEHRLKLVNSLYTEESTSVANGVYSITFTPTDKEATDFASDKVSFAETTNIAGFGGIKVTSVARGASVDLTAHKGIDGYEFVGWKRGANDDESAWVDISGDSYNVWTNTFLTAVYKPVGETTTAKTVDFWNYNGAYMDTAKDEAAFKEMVVIEPKLTGYGAFKGWFIDKDVKLTEDTVLPAGTTNAVAQYEDKVVSGVKRDGVAVDGEVVYNKAITFEKEDASSTCWKRDGEIISYDDTYTYNVWGATNITEGDDVITDKVPVGILEYSADHEAYMLEYDDGDYEIVEAGILFGGNLTVDGCTKKYTSQRKVSHNQFTVPELEGYTAKGYIIWKNASGAYQIDYFTE